VWLRALRADYLRPQSTSKIGAYSSAARNGLMSQHRILQAGALLLSALSLPALSDNADTPNASAYTVAQAATGKVAVESSCAICHLESLRGRSGEDDESPAFVDLPRPFQKFIKTGYVPPLVGDEFMNKWKSKTIVQLAQYLASAGKSFPTAGMDETTWQEIGAYVLQMNGVPAGDKELTASSTMTVEEALRQRKVAAAR
jgi:S-disulfanyl-L-cysteine oxidoreductase SoxD